MLYKTGVKTAGAGLLEKLILTFNNNKAKCDFVFSKKNKTTNFHLRTKMRKLLTLKKKRLSSISEFLEGFERGYKQR